MTSQALRGDKLVSQRASPADQMLTGEVCATCNNGWMDQLDRSVEHIVMGLARQPGNVQEVKLSEAETRAIGRWLLKVACVFQYSDRKDRRHIPHFIRSNLRKHNFLPPGFLAFAVRAPNENVEVALLDIWPAEYAGFPQSDRLKFAVRYNNVIFGCSYWLKWHPTYILTAGYHHPIVSSQASVRYELDLGLSRLRDLSIQFSGIFRREVEAAELAIISIDIEPSL